MSRKEIETAASGRVALLQLPGKQGRSRVALRDAWTAINEHRKTKGPAGAKTDQSGGSAGAGDTGRELSDLERVREGIQAVAKARDKEFSDWDKTTRGQIAKQLKRCATRQDLSLRKAGSDDRPGQGPRCTGQ